jgi:hypothetical protein
MCTQGYVLYRVLVIITIAVLTIDSKQPKALSIRYGQTDTIYSPFSGLDPTTAQMRRVDLYKPSLLIFIQ